VREMKINGIGTNNAINAYNENKKITVKNTAIEKKDSVEISKEARDLNSILNDNNISFKSSPEKIESVKKQISQGTYTPNSQLIAQKMVDVIKGRNI
jgi:negative regulator of flagellin synthesis FlgM